MILDCICHHKESFSDPWVYVPSLGGFIVYFEYMYHHKKA